MQIKGDGSGETESDGLKVYPKPMFDFNKQREICLAGMKNSYQVGMYGNDSRVMDGTWKKAFDDAAEGPTEGKQGGPGGLDTFEDADGTEENDTEPAEGKGKASKQSSPKASKAGHKREHSQGTLDGAFEKKRAKG